jgi:lysozyme
MAKGEEAMKIDTAEWIGDLLIKLGVATKIVEPVPVPKPEPKPEPVPVPKPEPKQTYLKAVRKRFSDNRGCEVIGLSICPVGSDTPISTLHCVSGQPNAQTFRLGRDSKAGSNEPLPQGEYSLGAVEWASGWRGDYAKNWNDGLGPVWVALTPKFNTERSALGLHLDANRTASPGSAGCLTVTTLDDLKTLVGWFDKYKPTKLVCDWQIANKPVDAAKPVVDVTKVSPNQSERTAKIDMLVVHNTSCNYDIAISTLMSPAEEVSAHLVIDRDGKTTQLVAFDKKAWHAVQANSRSIGIEIVAWKDAKGMTVEQEAKLVAWCRWAMKEYGITVQNIIMHRQIVATDCPSWLFPRDQDFDAWKKKWFAV